MRLEIASKKAIKYACMNFHYSKSIPNISIAFSVFNNRDEWCGVIAYGVGANNSIGNFISLNNGQIIELVRVALNGKQENTSKPISISIKLIKKKCPLVKAIVSYADHEQEHIGVIYQATNWYFLGSLKDIPDIYYYKNKWCHGRTIPIGLKKYLPKKKGSNKYKYIYPLLEEIKSKCEKLKKPYPKKSVKSIDSDATPFQEDEGGATPTLTHQ